MRLGWVPFLALAACAACAACAEGSAPIALVDYDRTVPLGETIVLDGRKSFDPQGEPLEYRWILEQHPVASSGELRREREPAAELELDAAGEYRIGLEVSAGGRNSERARVTLTTVAGGRVRADAGRDRWVRLDEPVELDGSGSVNPAGGELRYHWQIIFPTDNPQGVSSADQKVAGFRSFATGIFIFSLTVVDESGASDTDVVTIYIGLPRDVPIADAGEDQTVDAGLPVELMGNVVDYRGGELLEFAWSFASRPAGSVAVIEGADSQYARFTPDLPGEYLVALQITNYFAISELDIVQITAIGSSAEIRELDFRVVEADYSEQLDRLVLLSEDPSAVVIFDLANGVERSFALSAPGYNVSVGPDGREAIVGHSGAVTLIDLQTGTSTSIAVAGTAIDVALAGNGFAYAALGAQSMSLSAIDLTARTEQPTRLLARTIQLHPDERALYVAFDYTFIHAVDISMGAIGQMYGTPPDPAHSSCGALWLLRGSRELVTLCGHVFSTTGFADQPVVYRDTLAADLLLQHAWQSNRARLIAVVPRTAPEDRRVLLFDDTSLMPREPLRMPVLWHARAVFFSAAGDRLVAVAQAAPEAGRVLDYGLAINDL